VSPGEPIDFDFSNEPPRHGPPVSADGTEPPVDAGEPPVALPVASPGASPGAPVGTPTNTAAEPTLPVPPVPPLPPIPHRPAAGGTAAAAGAPAGAPITDFRTQSYPFATTSRFQQGGFSDPQMARRASHGRRMTWGILAALGAVLFAASVVVLMRVIDRSMHG
jgi:hypothetical protein